MFALKFNNLESFINVANKNAPSLFKSLKPPADFKCGKRTVIRPNMTRDFHSCRKNKYSSNIVEKLNTPVVMQVRFGYTDLKVPDFNDYRRDSTKDPTVRNKDTIVKRKLSSSLIIMSGAITGAYSTKVITVQMVMFMAASAEVLALSKIEVNLSDIPEGTNASIKWRGKPLFVKHRRASDIDATRAVDISTLRDPATDEDRCPYPEWLVVIGVCTHLGCVPISGIGDFPGGYYCPCHGSHFDGAGRARKGPAPSNLKIPQYTINDNILVVG